MNDELLKRVSEITGTKSKARSLSSRTDRERRAIERGAAELQIDPIDYATAISYESAGTFDPWVAGPTTKWGQHRGTIQYGEPQRKEYGVYEGQSFEDQVTNSNVRYLRDKGVKPGASFAEIYAAINGGSSTKDLSTPDWNTGRTIADNIRKAQTEHRSKVLQRYGWTDVSNEEVFSKVKSILSSNDEAEVGPELEARVAEIVGQPDLDAAGPHARDLLPKYEDPKKVAKLPTTNPAVMAPVAAESAVGNWDVSRFQDIEARAGDTPIPEIPAEIPARKLVPPTRRTATPAKPGPKKFVASEGRVLDEEEEVLPPAQQRGPTLKAIGTVEVDPNWSDEETVRFAANQVLVGKETPTGPITPEDVDRWISSAKERGDQYLVRGTKTGDPEKDSKFTVFGDMLEQIEAFKQKSPDQLKQEALERSLTPLPDEDLRKQAESKLWSDPLSAGYTPEDVEAEFQRLKRTQLSEGEMRRADAFRDALDNPQYGITGTLASGLLGGLARTADVARGVARLTGLDDTAAADLIAKASAGGARIGTGGPNESIGLGTVRMIGGLGADLPRLAAMSVLPGGIVTATAVDMGLQSAGRGDAPTQAVKETLKGAAQGGLARVAAPIGRDVFVNTNSKFLSTLATLGVGGVGTGVTELAFNPDRPMDALKAAVIGTVFSFIDAKEGISAGKKIRVKDNNGNQLSLQIREDGSVIDTVIPEGQPADIEAVVTDPVAATTRANEIVKEAKAKEPWQQTREEFNNSQTLVHGTSKANLESINNEGFRTDLGPDVRHYPYSELAPDAIYTAPKDSIWFTDPDSGRMTQYESQVPVVLDPSANVLVLNENGIKKLLEITGQGDLESLVKRWGAEFLDVPAGKREASMLEVIANSEAISAKVREAGIDAIEVPTNGVGKDKYGGDILASPQTVVLNANKLKTSDAAHRQLVQDAIAAGKPVPVEVLKDYPELINDKTKTFSQESSPVGETALASDQLPKDPTVPVQVERRGIRQRVADFVYPEYGRRTGELEKRAAGAERQAMTDELTGLQNTRALNEAKPSADADPNTEAVFLDANNFGQINKKLGDPFGDEVLKVMADSMVEAAAEVGGVRVFRKGGDEFVMYAPKGQGQRVADLASVIFDQKKVDLFAGKEYDGPEVSLTGTAGETLTAAEAKVQQAKAVRKGTAKPVVKKLGYADEVTYNGNVYRVRREFDGPNKGLYTVKMQDPDLVTKGVDHFFEVGVERRKKDAMRAITDGTYIKPKTPTVKETFEVGDFVKSKENVDATYIVESIDGDNVVLRDAFSVGDDANPGFVTLPKSELTMYQKVGDNADPATRVEDVDIIEPDAAVPDLGTVDGPDPIRTSIEEEAAKNGIFNKSEKDEIVEMHGTMFPFLQELFRRVTRPDTDVDVVDPNPTAHERLGSARGLPVEARLKRIAQRAVKIYQSFKRTFAEIDPNKDSVSALANDSFRRLSDNDNYSKTRALNDVYKITAGLGPKRLTIFERILVLRDLERDMEDGAKPRFGYDDIDDVRKSLKHYEDLAQADPIVMEALLKRQNAARLMARNLVDLGVMGKEVLSDYRYYHRQVPSAMEDAYLSTGTQDVRMRRKGFQMSRNRDGDIDDHNTNYIEAETEWMAQGYAQLHKAEIMNEIQAAADIKAELQAEAKVRGVSDWQTLIPKTHTAWQPKEGNYLFSISSVTDKQIDDLLNNNVIPSEFVAKIKTVMAQGQRRPEWVVPKEVASLLDRFKPDVDENALGRAAASTNSSWKQWTLINPRNAARYNIRNTFSDLDVAIMYDPKILAEIPGAIRDLRRYHKSRETTPDMDDAFKGSVLDSGMTFQEIPDISKTGIFQGLTKGDYNPLTTAWNNVKGFTQGRENVLRLASYRHFKRKVDAGEVVYGASTKSQVDAISDPVLKASKLARELMGDYGGISESGRSVRKHVMPFYSWVEINAPRYARVIRNLPNEGKGTGSLISRAGMTTAAKGGRLAAKALVITAAISAWNQAFFSEHEAELQKTEAGRKPHLIVGTREDGTPMIIQADTAIRDAMDWFGAGDFDADIMDVYSGKATVADKLADAPKAVGDRLFGGLGPQFKVLPELALGRQFFPSVFDKGANLSVRRNPIKDNWEYLARTVALDGIYKKVTGRPAPQGNTATQRASDWFLTSRIDADEALYWNARTQVSKYKEQQGKHVGEAPDPAERSNALFYYKQAIKWKDEVAAAKYLQEYKDIVRKANQGVSEKKLANLVDQGLKTSIDKAHPLAQLAKKDWDGYLATLNQAQREELAAALWFYKKSYNEKVKDIPGISLEQLQEAVR